MTDDLEPENIKALQAWLLGDEAIDETIGSSSADYGKVFTGDRVPDRLPTGTNPWLPRGPGNVGGRVRAFVPDIELAGGRPRALYAGAASGGVFRSLDDGLSWHSIWGHDMPSFGIGTIAVGGDAANRYLWVGTGEVGGLRGNGVYRMTLALGSDDLAAWEHLGTIDAMKGTGGEPRTLEASAVDPADGTICWFVGPAGIYRYRGDWSAWPLPTLAATSRQGRGSSDVKFMATTQGRYVVVAAERTSWGDLLLIDTPEATQAQIAAGIAAATIAVAPARVQLASPLYPVLPTAPVPAPPAHNARNVKVAIVPDAAGDRIYAIYGYTETTGDRRPILAMVTSTIAVSGGRPAWATPTMWATLHGERCLGGNQSEYNLVLLARAGAPAGPASDVVVLGMVNLRISVDSGVTFAPLNESWSHLFNRRIDYHPDFHAAFFDPARPARLWVGTDGGVAFSDAWLTGGAVTDVELANWRRRMSGLMASQVYDLAQHPLSDAMGIALQDVGGWRSSGSTTWRHVMWADGLGMSCDPYDPYRSVASSQDDVFQLNFDGAFDFQIDNVGGRRTLNRGVDRARVLSVGLIPGDAAEFEDTVTHPSVPGRIVHLREKRVYHSRDGERWLVTPVGNRFELFFRLVVPVPPPTVAPMPVPQMLGGIMVRIGGSAALKLGFLRGGETSTLREYTGEPVKEETYDLRILSARNEPSVVAADRLDLDIEVVTGAFTAPNRFVTPLSVVFPAAEANHGALLARIAATVTGALGKVWRPFGAAPAVAQIPLPHGEVLTMWTLPAFGGDNGLVEVVSDHVGVAAGLDVQGNGAATLCGTGAFRGAPGRPAVLTVRGGVQLAVEDTVEIQAQTTPVAPPGAPAQAVGGKGTLTITDFLDRSLFRSGRQLAGRLQRACDQGHGAYAVWWSAGKKSVRLRTGRLNRATPIAATITGNAVVALFVTAPTVAAVMFDLQPPPGRVVFDLSAVAPPPVRLTVTDASGGFARDIDFVADDFVGGLARATPEEVAAVIERVLTGPPAAPPANDWIVEVQRELTGAGPSEAGFSPIDPDVMWVGGSDRVYVSTDAGATWRDTFPSPVPSSDGDNDVENSALIEAIAPEAFPPEDAAHPVFRALVATRNNGAIYRVTSAATDHFEVMSGITLSSDYGSSKARVFAMVADPKRRDVYYAGTDVGVFRSANRGGSWSALSVGLPHAPVVDLAIDAGLDTLRAAVFGRGLFEKYLGDGTPLLSDVFFHANPRDGGRRPVNHGVDLDSDTPVYVDAARSPDLCLTSLAPGERAQFDAIELERIRNETVVPGVDYGLVMRPHNRTGAPISDARVIALWAPVEHEVPPLPAAFWTAAADAAVVASGTVFGAWTAIGSSTVPELPPGGARVVALPNTWTPPQLDRRDRLALLAYVQRGVEVPGAGEVDATSLVLRDGRAAMRLASVQQDDRFVTLRVIAPATGTVVGLQLHAVDSALAGGGAPAAKALVFTPIGAPGPQTVRTKAEAPFDVRDLQLTFTFHETLVSQQPTFVPPAAAAPTQAATLRDPPGVGISTFDIDFREANLAAPNIASAAQVRQFLASRLRQKHRLLIVEDATVALSLQRSAVDARVRRGGTSWQGGAVVVTAAGTAAVAADFAPAALAAPAVVTIGALQRFTVRVWNHGDLDVTAPDTTVSLFWFDPHTDTPQEHALGAAQQIAITAGQFADVPVEDTIAAISHDDVLVLAQVDHPADPVRPRGFADWGALRQWAAESDNTLARLLRRR